MAPNPRRLDARLDALYERIPTLPCKGICFDSCGPIAMSNRERARIETGLARVTVVKRNGVTACSMLDQHGRCSCYDIRPAICRLWGVAEGMECPYGCKPERYLTRGEAMGILMETLTIGGGSTEQQALHAIKQMLETLPEDDEFRLVAESMIAKPTIAGRVNTKPKSVIDRD
jgi:hypothetical protein